ncbi:sulfur dehydrogenase subunit SoxD [Panacagrimonas perspica]|uniref:Cytochrome c-551 n=1 Tax=Panacagrimonas perspica TaxID=381431 RepID=A0A4R7NYU3_9GAMM|nr:c-type cytochrome [Panacagrimonas perspica]TDU26515.1 sulfur dehydrogenase subunit SoxD [Panacagrimonas perspica]
MKHIALLCLLGLLATTSSVVRADYAGVGRSATDAEIRAWDIDVRPDFVGLPAGQGSVSEGEALWSARCASCHGDFGDANHVFTPLIGNTTADDIRTGRVASLKAGGSYRTTFTKVSSISTLWDYINRAMPWDRPKSLSPNEVYAALAYLLHLADIVPADFVLSDKTMANVQARLPNRNGMTQEHGLWKVGGKADTRAKPCMQDCLHGDVVITSALPDHARGSHGDLAKQNRSFGAVRGVELAMGAETASPATAPVATGLGTKRTGPDVTPMLSSNGCLGCHAIDAKLLGPSFKDVAAKYADRKDATAYLASKIRGGSSGVWGVVPMPPFAQLPDETMKAITEWIAGGAAQ